MKKFISSICISILLQVNIFNQILSDVKFDHLGVDNGLSNSSVICIFQDRSGYMWIGTRDGLNRYNGYEFRTFQNEKKNQNSLVDNWIFSLNQDYKGIIWIGTRQGINSYDPAQDKITRYVGKVEGYELIFPSAIINKIKIFRDSTVWFATNNGIVIIDPRSNTTKWIKNEVHNPNSLISDVVSDIVESANDIVYIANELDPIQQYNRKTGKFTTISYKNAELSLSSNNLKQMVMDDEGKLWIGSGGGIHILDPVTNESTFIGTGEGMLNNGSTTGGIMILGRNVWIGCDGGGINIYNRDTKEFSYIINSQKNKFSLSRDAVYCMYKDRNDNIWVGVYNGGVNIIDKYKWKFKSYKNNTDDPTSISANTVQALFQDSKGRLWVGTGGGGLNLMDLNTGKFQHFRRDPTKKNTFSTDVIVCLNEDNMGNILIGTFNGGLESFNVEKDQVTTFIPDPNNPDAIVGYHVWNIFRDNKDRIWLGRLSETLDQFFPNTKVFLNYTRESAGSLKMPRGNIMTIAQDKTGKLWLGGEGMGLIIMDEDKNQLITYKNDPENTNSLSNNDIKCILFDGDYAWIATNGGGLDKFDILKNTFKHYTSDEGLPSNSLMGMLQDDKGNLWISSTKGLFRFEPKTEKIIKFDKNDGLQSNEFRYNSQLKLKDGRMLFGGIEGLSIFSPDSVRPNPNAPSIVFTGFLINNKPVPVNEKHSPLKKHINEAETIILNHKQSVFTIEYAALNYTSTEKNHYKYMMKGFDDDWVDAGTNRSVTYTNLNAGKYIFKVIASNNDDIWNEEGREISIRIKPAWWQTWWFYSIIFVIILAAIYSFIKWREKQSEHDKFLLEEKIKEGEKLIAEKVSEVEAKKEEIRMREIEERNMHWHNEGLNIFSHLFSKNTGSIEGLTKSFLNNMIEYVGANMGAMFLLNDELENDVFLQLTASYAYPISEKGQLNFQVGESQVGICFQENRIIEYDNIPDGYFKIGSGLGKTTPKSLVLLPINLDQNKIGVIEIASFQKLEPYKINFIQKINETLTSILSTEKANARMRLLLERMNMQAEELKAHEEEMRQNLEEMQATQEEARRREEELLAIIKEKDQKLTRLK
jgi:ligand-binding sensor domain-containing protein